MALSPKEQTLYWGVAALAVGGLLWAFGSVLMPFILGGAFAYLLDPLADRLQRLGLGRMAATVAITLLAALAIVLGLLLVLPTLITQAGALIQQIGTLIQNAPAIYDRVESWLGNRFPALDLDSDVVRDQLADMGAAVRNSGGAVLSTLVSSAMSLVNLAVFIVIVPVVTFYLLMDWDRMIGRIDDLLPRDHAATIRRLGREIDATLAGFIRGQGTVVLILMIYYSAALMIAGLQFGLIIGVVTGLISFIPYIGAIVGGALAIGVAMVQWWAGTETVDGATAEAATNWLRIGIVIAIYLAGQFLEGNILTPNLVGGSVGLHPVWLLLALSVFGSLFGFVGMLVAVPVAAMIGVLVRFGTQRYRDSPLYRGTGDGSGDRSDDAGSGGA